MELAARDPVKAAQLCQKEISALDAGYHSKLHHYIGVGYAIGFNLAKKSEAWRCFTKKRFWGERKKRPGPKHQDQALLYAMVYVFAALTKQLYDRAWKYATALKPFLDKGVRPEKVAAMVRKNGIEVYIERAQQARANQKREQEEEENASWEEDHDAGTPEEEEIRPSSPKSRRQNNDDVIRSCDDEEVSDKKEAGTNKAAQNDKMLKLVASPDIRKKVEELASGKKARLTIKGTKTDSPRVAHHLSVSA